MLLVSVLCAGASHCCPCCKNCRQAKALLVVDPAHRERAVAHWQHSTNCCMHVLQYEQEIQHGHHSVMGCKGFVRATAEKRKTKVVDSPRELM